MIIIYLWYSIMSFDVTKHKLKNKMFVIDITLHSNLIHNTSNYNIWMIYFYIHNNKTGMNKCYNQNIIHNKISTIFITKIYLQNIDININEGNGYNWSLKNIIIL